MNEEPNSVEPSSATVDQLIDALNDMRDKLVNLALSLHDYKFSLETPARQELDQVSQELIEKVKRLNC